MAGEDFRVSRAQGFGLVIEDLGHAGLWGQALASCRVQASSLRLALGDSPSEGFRVVSSSNTYSRLLSSILFFTFWVPGFLVYCN